MENADAKNDWPKNNWDDGGGLKWLYLDMNSYFASCEQQDNPYLRRQPLIVVPVMSDYTCAIAASLEAKALGIKTGTSVGEAKRICPQLHVVEARPNRYVELHHKIIQQVERIIPVEAVCSIDEVACLLMGPQKLEVCARALGHRIQRAILERVGGCLTASIGIGPSKLLAKTAADMQKPLGLTILRQDNLPGPLLTLEIDDFAGIGRAMTRRLNVSGIYDVRQLWDLSPSRFRQLWGGVVGENFWYAMHGIDPPETETMRASISHSHVLASALRPVAEARGVARRLTAKCGSRLRRMGYKCSRLQLSVRGERANKAQAEMKFNATSDSFHLLDICDQLWTKCMSELKVSRVQKISVTCLRMRPVDSAPDLFGWTPQAEEDPKNMKLLGALDQLNQRYGKDAITIGPRTKVHGFVGAKIAFNRVPENNEFRE